jgi:hypothetical protein
MLQQAWILNNIQAEVRAYHHLGIEYFYLVELKKSKYYYERFQRGIKEERNSIVKSIYVQEDKINKVRHYLHPNLDIMNLKDNPFDNPLPTPSEGRYKK